MSSKPPFSESTLRFLENYRELLKEEEEGAHFSKEKRLLENAAKRFEEQKKALFNDAGERIYSDEEHARRMNALLEEFDKTKAAVEAQADKASEEARATLDLERGGDPTDALTTEELSRANAKKGFVEEDALKLSLPDVTRRVKAAALAEDKVSMFLWHRYGRERHASELESLRSGGASDVARTSALVRALEDALSKLEEKLTDPQAEKRITSAKEKIAAADELKVAAFLKRQGVDGTRARQLREAVEHFRSTF